MDERDPSAISIALSLIRKIRDDDRERELEKTRVAALRRLVLAQREVAHTGGIEHVASLRELGAARAAAIACGAWEGK